MTLLFFTCCLLCNVYFTKINQLINLLLHVNVLEEIYVPKP